MSLIVGHFYIVELRLSFLPLNFYFNTLLSVISVPEFKKLKKLFQVSSFIQELLCGRQHYKEMPYEHNSDSEANLLGQSGLTLHLQSGMGHGGLPPPRDAFFTPQDPARPLGGLIFFAELSQPAWWSPELSPTCSWMRALCLCHWEPTACSCLFFSLKYR